MIRTFIIGDIHGGLKALKQVLERARVTTTDKLVFLGDYVDGWSESAGVIGYLMSLQQQQHCLFIKGNHDSWCEDWLRTGNADSQWVFNGGRSTIESYKTLSGKSRQDHLNFLEQMKFYEVDEKNRLFIHAGFTSMHGPRQEFHTSNFGWDRTLWEMAVAIDSRIEKGSALFPKRLKLFHEIYIGHTPTVNFNSDVPMQGANVWNMDTGAAFLGKLTIMDIDTKQFWQSDPVISLYHGETGRHKSQ